MAEKIGAQTFQDRKNGFLNMSGCLDEDEERERGGRLKMNKEVKWIVHGKKGPNDGKLIKWSQC